MCFDSDAFLCSPECEFSRSNSNKKKPTHTHMHEKLLTKTVKTPHTRPNAYCVACLLHRLCLAFLFFMVFRVRVVVVIVICTQPYFFSSLHCVCIYWCCYFLVLIGFAFGVQLRLGVFSRSPNRYNHFLQGTFFIFHLSHDTIW